MDKNIEKEDEIEFKNESEKLKYVMIRTILEKPDKCTNDYNLIEETFCNLYDIKNSEDYKKNNSELIRENLKNTLIKLVKDEYIKHVYVTEDDLKVFAERYLITKDGLDYYKRTETDVAEKNINNYIRLISCQNSELLKETQKYFYYEMGVLKTDINRKNELLKNSTNKQINQSFKKIDELEKKISNLSEDTRIKKLEERAKKLETELNNKEKEIKDIQRKMIEILGVFISIFTLISANIGYFSILKDIAFNQKISLILIINCSLLLAIIVLLYVINKLIVNDGKNNKGVTVISILIILTLIMSLVLVA